MNSHPPCSDWAEKLVLRREDLSHGDREALDEHVEGCSACRQTREDYNFLDVALRALPDSVAIPSLSFPPKKLVEYKKVPQSPQYVDNNLLHKTVGIIVGIVFIAAFVKLGFLCYYKTTNASEIVLHTCKLDNTVSAVACSPNGSYIAVGSWDHTVQVWNATSGKLVTTYTDQGELANVLAWSPDSKYIVSGSADATVQVWNAFTGNTLVTYRGHTAGVSALAWSPDGKEIASGSWDHTVQIWNASTGQPILTHLEGSDFVNTLAWSPSGQEIASGGNDTDVQIWDTQSGVTRLVYDYAISGPVDAIAWSSDGKKIAYSGPDTLVMICDANTKKLFFIYRLFPATTNRF